MTSMNVTRIQIKNPIKMRGAMQGGISQFLLSLDNRGSNPIKSMRYDDGLFSVFYVSGDTIRIVSDNVICFEGELSVDGVFDLKNPESKPKPESDTQKPVKAKKAVSKIEVGK